VIEFHDDFGLHPASNREFVHKRRHLTTALVHVDLGTGITAQHLSEARKAFSRNPWGTENSRLESRRSQPARLA
jgi:hypothetical protein